MKKHLLLIFLFIFATGCASINKINDSILNQGVRYKEPVTGKTANVRVFLWVR